MRFVQRSLGELADSEKPERKKTKAEVMSEIIAKSKEYKVSGLNLDTGYRSSGDSTSVSSKRKLTRTSGMRLILASMISVRFSMSHLRTILGQARTVCHLASQRKPDPSIQRKLR